MRKVYSIDTNILIRLITQDHEEYFSQAKNILGKIQQEKIKVHITEGVIMEVLFICMKNYHISQAKIINYLKDFLQLSSVFNRYSFEILLAFRYMEKYNIDLMDALLIVRKRLYNYEPLSFDKEVVQVSNEL